jgi:hypothetical protein
MARVTCETGGPSLAQADRGAPVTDAPATLADGAASGESGVSVGSRHRFSGLGGHHSAMLVGIPRVQVCE